MMINKTKFISYLIVFTLGVVFAKMFLEKECPEIIVDEPVVTITETVDTTTSTQEINFQVPAQIKKKCRSQSITASLQDSGHDTPVPAVAENIVACFDSVRDDGFEAHVCYDYETRHFFNRFVIPEKVITKEKVITVDNTKQVIKRELPDYLLGLGVKSFLKDNTITTLPFISLSANRKLWFLIAQIELKALTRLNEGSIKMEPEIEGNLYVPL